jgi:hypothetical protein
MQSIVRYVQVLSIKKNKFNQYKMVVIFSQFNMKLSKIIKGIVLKTKEAQCYTDEVIATQR